MHYQGYTNEYLDSSKAKWGPCPSQTKKVCIFVKNVHIFLKMCVGLKFVL